MSCNVLSPQLFWVKSFRRNVALTFGMSIFINIGMWFERFVIIATTLARDYLPSSWSYYSATWVEVGLFVGTLGLFSTLFLTFTRIAPVVAIAEIKSILKTAGDQYVGPEVAKKHAAEHGHVKVTTNGHDDHDHAAH
jgi:molybdopterin-containing oxidoreductase family membrane subunit